MAEKYRFFDAVLQEDGVTYDREYDAQEFTDYFKALVTTGIMKGAGNQLAVTANGTNMITKIDTGIAFLLGRYYENDSFKELTHDTETLGNSRIDRIVIRMDLSTEARYVKTFIKKGAPSTNPVAPTLTQTPNLYEISLAQVKVVGGQTFIAINAVTDERGIDVICPWAGSKILPNFDADGLQELIDSQLVDGNRVRVWSNWGDTWKDPQYNLNNLQQQGFWFAFNNFGSTVNTHNFPNQFDNNKWLIQVFSLRPEGPLTGQNYIIQVAFAVGANGIANYGGMYKRSTNHQGENWTQWVRVDRSVGIGHVYATKYQNQVLPPNAETIMQWNNGNAVGDKDLADQVQITRFHIPAYKNIKNVRLTATIDFDGTSLAGKNCNVIIRKNGTYVDQSQNNAMCPTGMTSVRVTCVTPPLAVNVGDYFEVVVTQNGTVSANTPSSRGVFFAMEVIDRD